MELKEFKIKLEGLTEFEIRSTCNYMKKYIEVHNDELSGIDGFQLCLISSNLIFFARIEKSISELTDSDEEFVTGFEEILKLHMPAVEWILNEYVEEVDKMKLDEPGMYEKYLEIIKSGS